MPDTVNVIKARPIIQARVGALLESEVGFSSDSKMRREHKISAGLTKCATHFGREENVAVSESVGRGSTRTGRGGSHAEIDIQPALCIGESSREQKRSRQPQGSTNQFHNIRSPKLFKAHKNSGLSPDMATGQVA